MLDTLRLVENLDAGPAVDRILENILIQLAGGPISDVTQKMATAFDRGSDTDGIQ